MNRPKRKLLTLTGVTLCVTALGGAVAFAQSSDDTWTTGQANASWSATGTTSFSGSGVTITCSNDSASGSSTGSAPDAGLIAINDPTFSGCGDSNSWAANHNNGPWQIAFWSDLGPTGGPPKGCPIVGTAQSGQDEGNGNKDCVQLQIPKLGLVWTIQGICTVTFAPNGPESLYGYLTENAPPRDDTITLPTQTVTTSGTCGVVSGTFSSTFTLPSVSGSYLDDASGPDGDADS